jgi:hypothetical protein
MGGLGVASFNRLKDLSDVAHANSGISTDTPRSWKTQGPSFDLPTAKPETVCKNAGHAHSNQLSDRDSDAENKAPFSESIRK